MTRIGEFEILGILQPGPRPLYRARAADGRVAALKTVSAAGLTAEMRERFLREFQISASFDHPNLLRTWASGEADGVLFQAMDLLEGCDLDDALAARRAFTWDERLTVMEQVADGLAYLHARAIVHRDVTPANIFLESSGRVRLLDAGMARSEGSQLTELGMAVGTMLYMAPEQVRGEACTPATDVFAAGIVFYLLATGAHPFKQGTENVAEILKRVLFEPPALSELGPDAPDGLDFVLGKALAKDPVQRLQTGADLKHGLGLCRIMLRLQRAAPPGSGAADLGKTIVVPRPAVVDIGSRPATAAAPAMPLASPAASQPAQKRVTFCPMCTAPNAPDAEICVKCGAPLRAPVLGKEGGPPDRTWTVQSAIAAAVFVAMMIAAWIWSP